MMKGDANGGDHETMKPVNNSMTSSLDNEPDPVKAHRFDYFHGNREARALAINHIAQGFFLIGGVYISTAILGLAYTVGDCATLPPPECTVWGLKPSSLLSTMTSISAFVSALCMPFIGVIVDHTDYRRCIAFCSGMITVGLNFIEIFISAQTYQVIIIVHIITPVVSLLHQMSIFAYFYEITNKSHVLTKYLSIFQGWRQLSMLVCVLFVLLLSKFWPGITPGTIQADVVTARIAQTFITIISFISICLTYYKGLQSRKAVAPVPPGSNIYTLGFTQLYRTLMKITKQLPAVRWYLIACAFYGSLLGSTVAVAITYLKFYLKFSLSKIAISTVVYLLASVGGATVVPFITSKIGILRTLQLIVFCIMVVWGLVGILEGPQQGNWFFLCAFAWGFFGGMIIPVGRALFLRITPRGQETELMGIFLFFINGFVWLPPLIMTVINEQGLSFRYIMPILGVFDFVALILLFLIGDFETAREAADKISIENMTGANDLEGNKGEAKGELTPMDDTSKENNDSKELFTVSEHHDGMNENGKESQ